MLLKKLKLAVSRKSKKLRLLASPLRKLPPWLKESVLRPRRLKRLALLRKRPLRKPGDSKRKLRRENVSLKIKRIRKLPDLPLRKQLPKQSSVKKKLKKLDSQLRRSVLMLRKLCRK